MTTLPTGGDPTRVGRFEVRARLQGGTLRVYRAHDPRFDRDVTLRLWPCPADDATAAVDRLIRRHRAAAELRHPAILPVYEVGQADGWCYVAGAFVEGPRLAEALADGPLAVRRAAVVARELADGLALAHERGFVHGAVHPSGVVLSEDGSAAWLDFGAEADDPPRHPAYTAPERLGDPPGPADTASDQYGLGALLFAMLTGDPPFVGDDEEVTARALAADRAPSSRRDRPEVPPDLDAVCRQAIAPNPADRYRTCGELADDIRRWLEGGPVTARAVGLRTRLRRAPGLVLVMALLALLGLAAAGGGGWWWLQVRQAQRMAEMARAEAMAARAQAEQARLTELTARQKAETEQATLSGRQSDEARARARAEKERDQARLKAAELELRLKTEKDRAKEDKKDLTDERDKLEAVVYDQLVGQSHRAWQDRDPARARALLEGGRPKDKKRPDRRGWEWFYLERLYRPPQTFTFKPEESRLANTEPRAADGTDLRRYVCAYSPDGAYLAVSLFDDRVTVWNAVLGGAALTIEGTRGPVCDIAYSPDGKHLVTAGADKLARLWDPATGAARHKLKGHSDAVLAVAFSPDSQLVATGGADREAIIWEASGTKKHTLKGHEAAVLAAAFSPDGATLATADAVGAVRLWEVKSGECKTTIAAHAGAVGGLAFAPDGQRLATAGEDRVVKIWDAHSGQEQRVLSGPAKPLRSVAFRPDGQRLAAAGDDLTVSVWDLSTGRLSSFPTGHTAPIQRVVYRPDGRQLATASADGTLKLWDPDRPTGLDAPAFRGHGDAVLAVAVSPDGRRLATAGQDKTVRLWDARSGEVTRTLEGHTGPVRAVAFSKDGKTLATGGDDNSAKVWDVASGQVQLTVSGHKDAILGVALSPDGKKLATASKDGTARVRETATGQSLFTLRGHTGAVTGVAFSPDGKRVLTTGADGSARSWDAETGREVAAITDRVEKGWVTLPPGARQRDPLAQPGAYPAHAAYSPKGNRVAFACRDGSILLVDSTNVFPRVLMEGHDGLVRCLAFSPDGRRLASGDGQGTVKVWDVRTGLEVLNLAAHDGAVNGLAFSPDGDVLYTAGSDHAVKAWDGTPLDGRPRPEQTAKEGDEQP
ncbi:MAG TPA: protein kinase [Gemmataceae bacterium]|jgi:WD40 repeat protein